MRVIFTLMCVILTHFDFKKALLQYIIYINLSYRHMPAAPMHAESTLEHCNSTILRVGSTRIFEDSTRMRDKNLYLI
jgi:hypothetical protein